MVDKHAALNETFAALSDPTRRAIVARLTAGSATVLEIAEPFEMSLNAVSKHLKKLERAGLIRRKVVGREHHCSLDPEPLKNADSWIETYREFWERRLDAMTEMFQAEDEL